MLSDPFGIHPRYRVRNQERASAWPLLSAMQTPRLSAGAVRTRLLGTLAPATSWFDGVERVPLDALSLPDVPASSVSPEALRAALSAAVAEALQEGRCAILLSGGVDSALLAALAAREDPRLEAFTLADDFADDGELERARTMARHAGVRLTELPIRQQDLAAHAEAAICACEAPLINGKAVASHLAFQALSAAGVTRAISGLGADEVLMGNPADLPAQGPRRRREGEIAARLLEGERPAEGSDDAGPRTAVWDREASGTDLATLRVRTLQTVLPELTLPPETRASQAAGVRVVLPYLHPGVVELALGTPLARLVDPAVGGLGKLLLREAARALVPEVIRLRPKVPRYAPVARGPWLELYAAWSTPERLARVPGVSPARVAEAIAALAAEPDGPRSSALDSVLMQVTSFSVLADRAWKLRWRASS